jgi:hypothetical protein
LIITINIKLEDWNTFSDMRRVDMREGEAIEFYMSKCFVFIAHVMEYVERFYPEYEYYKIIKFSETESSEVMLIKKNI